MEKHKSNLIYSQELNDDIIFMLNLDKHSTSKMENQAERMATYLFMTAKFLKRVYAGAVTEPVLISNSPDHFVITEEFAQYRFELTYQH